jgi:hypothetical protein
LHHCIAQVLITKQRLAADLHSNPALAAIHLLLFCALHRCLHHCIAQVLITKQRLLLFCALHHCSHHCIEQVLKTEQRLAADLYSDPALPTNSFAAVLCFAKVHKQQ